MTLPRQSTFQALIGRPWTDSPFVRRRRSEASDYSPVEFKLTGESVPGRPADAAVGDQQCVRIMTGAPIPEGADAVVPAEFASEGDDVVRVTTAVSVGKHVGRVGEDVRTGEVLLRSGHRLRPQDLGLVASLGIDRVSVIRSPRVRIVTTGGEVVPPGDKKGAFQIFDANSSMLRSLVERDGGQVETHRRLRDDPQRLRETLLEAGADVVLVSGGSSVGREDFAPVVLREVGELPIHGVAMRPSSPTGIGCIGNSLVFLLPGNPVSCMCAYDFFAGRAIRLIGGRDPRWPYSAMRCSLSHKIASQIGRLDYCRVILNNDGTVRPLAISGASILSSLTRADGFVIVPAGSEGFPSDADVTVNLYSGRSANQGHIP